MSGIGTADWSSLGRRTSAIFSFVGAFMLICIPVPQVFAAAGEQADELFRTAQKAQEEGYFNQATEGFRKFVKMYPKDERASWALVQVGDLQVQQSMERDAIPTFGAVIRDYPASMEARLARSRLAQISETVLEGIREQAKTAPTEEDKMKALWEIGELYLAMQDYRQAAMAFQDVGRVATLESWKKKTSARLAEIVEVRIKETQAGTPVPNEAEWLEIAQLAEVAESWPSAAEYFKKLSEVASDPSKKAEYTIACARALQHSAKYQAAYETAMGVVNSDLRGGLREDAYQCAGLALESSKEYAKALKLYDQFLTEADNEKAMAWAMLRRAFCLERAGMNEAALNTYREIVDRYPKEFTAPEALIGSGRIYEARREFPAARTAYTRVTSDYPESHKVVEAKSLLQAMTAKEQDWERVKQELSKMSERYPKRERKEGEGM